MTKEKLMEWGLTEEQANKVMEGLNGSFVTKSRFNEVNEENKTLKAQVSERDGQIETLKKSAGDNTELQNQIWIRWKPIPSTLWVAPPTNPPLLNCFLPSVSGCGMMWARSFRWYASASWPTMKVP